MAERKRSVAGQTLVFFGDGKGKTTAAFGVALRAVGRGWKVLMIQYTKMGEWPKGEPMGEINGARRLAPDFEVISTGSNGDGARGGGLPGRPAHPERHAGGAAPGGPKASSAERYVTGCAGSAAWI